MRLHDAKFGQMPAAQTMHPATVDNMKLKDDTASLTVLSCFYTMVRELTAIANEHGKEWFFQIRQEESEDRYFEQDD